MAALIWFAADSQTRNMVEISDDAATEITDLMSVQIGAAARFGQIAALEDIFRPQIEREGSMIASVKVIDLDGDVVSTTDGSATADFESEVLDIAPIDTSSFAGIEERAVEDLGTHLVVATPIRFGNDNALIGSLIISWSRGASGRRAGRTDLRPRARRVRGPPAAISRQSRTALPLYALRLPRL